MRGPARATGIFPGARMGTVVDIHTHIFPLEVVDYIRSGKGPGDVRVEDRAGKEPLIVHGNGLAYPVFPAFYDSAAKLEQMDGDGIDVSVVSMGSSLFLFELDPAETARVHRVVNDAAAAYGEAGGERIVAMATVPMNDPVAAADELRRAHALGLRGAHVGTSVEAMMLDDRALDPFFAAAEELGMPVVLHPYTSMTGDPPPALSGYHLSNVIGNPLETCVAASRIVVGGVFDRYPGLRVVLVHGGGSFPYQLGRLDHAYDVRAETKAVARRKPSSYLENLMFDTLIFDERALRFLVSIAGSSQVMFGTDTPFDMRDLMAQDAIAEIAPEAADDILGGNAIRAFGLEVDAER